MSSAVAVFVHAICRRSKKYLAQQMGKFSSLGLIPMIVICSQKNYKLQYNHVVFLHVFVECLIIPS